MAVVCAVTRRCHLLTQRLVQVKEYLSKIYQLPVKKINTANVMGNRKRIMGRRKIYSYKRPDFKMVRGWLWHVAAPPEVR